MSRAGAAQRYDLAFVPAVFLHQDASRKSAAAIGRTGATGAAVEIVVGKDVGDLQALADRENLIARVAVGRGKSGDRHTGRRAGHLAHHVAVVRRDSVERQAAKECLHGVQRTSHERLCEESAA